MPNLPENVRTDPEIEPESKAEIAKRNKKGKREPTSLHVDPALWQEVRVMAVLKNVSLADYFEDALRRKIDADNLEAGRQGYKIGQGGMYIPPPPSAAPAPTQQPQPQAQIEESPQPQQHYKKGDQIDFGKPIMAPIRNGQVEINLTLPELSFPTDKEKIRQSLKKSINEVVQTIPLNSDPEVLNNLKHYLEILRMNLDIVENLLMFKKVYKNIEQLEEEIIKAPKNRLANLHIKHRPEGTIGGCKIRWGPDIIKDRMGMRLIT
jgi:hypothetical protein